MSPERSGRLWLMGVTAAVTLAGVAVVGTVIMNQRPPTPRLAPPKSITVTLHPIPDWGLPGCRPTRIPDADIGRVMELVTPGRCFEGGIHEHIHPLVAVVVLTHEGGTDTWISVRDTGKNPAAVSVDGRRYFYARSRADVHDGGMQLAALVRRIAGVDPR